ncbi:MAG: hypothetical protein ACI8PZ_000416 [Myxococcota bacterium]|jgi:hypothetical protein
MEEDSRFVAWLKERPYVVFLWMGFILAGPVIGVAFLQDAYGFVLALAAGLVGGAGSAMIVTVNRILDS